jgi:hypothetical protein
MVHELGNHLPQANEELIFLEKAFLAFSSTG